MGLHWCSPYAMHENPVAMSKKALILIVLLVALELLFAVYLPINNIVEYWTNDPGSLSMHFYIFAFAGFAFYVLFGQWIWKRLSPTGRKLFITAIVGWTLNLYLICVDPMLNRTEEAYDIGAMVMIGPCLVALLDRLVHRIKSRTVQN
jgi:hypothetical protein